MMATVQSFTCGLLEPESLHGSTKAAIVSAEHIQDRDPPRARWQPLSEFLFFKIVLCPISGEIEVLARDFEFSTS